MKTIIGRIAITLLALTMILPVTGSMIIQDASAEETPDSFKSIDIRNSSVTVNGVKLSAKIEYDYQAGQNRIDIICEKNGGEAEILLSDYNIELKNILTDGSTVYYVKNDGCEDDQTELIHYTICEYDYHTKRIKELFSKDGSVSGAYGTPFLDGYYDNKLIYLVASGTYCEIDYYDLNNRTEKEIVDYSGIRYRLDNVIVYSVGKSVGNRGNGDQCFPIESYDLKTDIKKRLTDNALKWNVIKSKIYYVESLNNKNGTIYDENLDSVCRVIECNFDGSDKKILLDNQTVKGYVDAINETGLICYYYDENDNQISYSIPFDQMSDEEYALYRADNLSNPNGTSYASITGIQSLPYHDPSGIILDNMDYFDAFLATVYDSKLGIGYLEDPKTAIKTPVRFTDIYYVAIIKILKESTNQSAIDAYNQIVSTIKSTEGDIKGALDVVDTGVELASLDKNESDVLYNKIVGNLKQLFDNKTYTEVTDYVAKVIKKATSVKDVLTETQNACTLYLINDSYKQVLKEMYDVTPTNDTYFRSALDKAMAVCDSPIIEGVYYGGQLTVDTAIDTYWGAFLKEMKKQFPELKAIFAAADVGHGLGDIISNASDIINAQYESAALSDITNNVELVYKKLVNKYLKNRTLENAGKLNACVDMLRKAYSLNYDTALKWLNSRESSNFNKIIAYFSKSDGGNAQARTDLTEEKNGVDKRFSDIEKQFSRHKISAFEKKIRYSYVFECPITVTINGGSYINSSKMHSTDDVLMVLDGDKKIIYLTEDQTADISITGDDSGTMNCTVDDLEKNVELQSFINVPVTKKIGYKINSKDNILKDTKTKEIVNPEKKIVPVMLKNGIVVNEKDTYYVGENLQIEARVPYGYIFKKWVNTNGNSDIFADSTSSITEIKVPENGASVEADIEKTKTTYSVTTSAGEGGMFLQGDNIIVDENDDCGLVIVAKDGYELSDVKIDGQSVGNKQNYIIKNVTSDHKAEAVFEKKTSSDGNNDNSGLSGGTDKTNDSLVNPNPPGTRSSYTITYNLNGGTASNNPTTYTSDTGTFTLENPVRTGYTFIGWTGSNGNNPQMNVSVQKGTIGDLSFTANWLMNSNPSETTYNISYNLNGGTAVGNPATYTADTSTFTLLNPVRIGYTFIGWTGSNGSIPQINVTVQKGTIGNLLYTANWLENIPENNDLDDDSADLLIQSIESKTGKIKKLSSTKNKVTMIYKKIKISGKKVKYQVAIKTPKAKKWNKSTLSGTKKIFKKLKKNQKYWISVRPYIIVNGMKCFGEWAETKVIKTKR